MHACEANIIEQISSSVNNNIVNEDNSNKLHFAHATQLLMNKSSTTSSTKTNKNNYSKQHERLEGRLEEKNEGRLGGRKVKKLELS